jgi:nucleoside-diphosphate-sugar epimerase
MRIMLIGGCGYIGSALYSELTARGHLVDSVDLERRGNPGMIPNRRLDYAQLSAEDLSPYETVVLLAAHASVAEATADPQGAFRNNVIAFHGLLEILGDRRLVYASSSSVYTGMGPEAATESSQWSAIDNMYDFSKFIDDGLALLSHAHYYGLRFGTVNGPSPNIRDELMFNRMVQSAIVQGRVRIASVHVHRPILAVKDLTRAVTAIVEGSGSPGVYNLASFNTTVLEAGTTTSRLLGVPLEIDLDRKTYDFSIDTTKFQREYEFSFKETAEGLITELAETYRSGANVTSAGKL